jgi:hypothetical protein
MRISDQPSAPEGAAAHPPERREGESTPPAPDRRARGSLWRVPRETRLLLLTIAVSVGALLLLSRFRFPEQTPILNPSPPPLERLAARATYDELAAIITQLQARIQAGVIVLDAAAPPPPSAPPAAISSQELSSQYLPAVRVDRELVLMRLPAAARVQGVIGQNAAVPIVLARDPLRQLALVRVPEPGGGDGERWLREQPVPTRVPGYFAVAEGGRGGLTLRPLFVSRLDPVNDPRWDRPLLAMGGFADAPPGSFIFTLEGSLVGLVIDDEGMRLVVPLQSLEAAVKRLTNGPLPVPGELGIDVQALTPALSQATGARQGVIVARVGDGGPAATALRFGDVIQSIDGEPTYSMEAYEHRLSTIAAGDTVKLAIIRNGQASTVTLTARRETPTAARPSASTPAALGLSLRSAAGIGAQVLRVQPGSVAADAGFELGDLITRIDQDEAPTPAAVQRAYLSAPSGAQLLVGVERDGRALVLALAKP